MEIDDVTCPICLYIIIKPVTLPCNHHLCLVCFERNVKEANFCCPICRKRISSWARKAYRSETLVNTKIWEEIQRRFPDQVQMRLMGMEEEDLEMNALKISIKLAKPGEIRNYYEQELKKLQEEQAEERRKEQELSEQLIQKILEKEGHSIQEKDGEQLLKLQEEQAEERRKEQELSEQLIQKILEKEGHNIQEKDGEQLLKVNTEGGGAELGNSTSRESMPSSTIENFLDQLQDDSADISSPPRSPYPYTCLTPISSGGKLCVDREKTKQIEDQFLQKKIKKDKNLITTTDIEKLEKTFSRNCCSKSASATEIAIPDVLQTATKGTASPTLTNTISTASLHKSEILDQMSTEVCINLVDDDSSDCDLIRIRSSPHSDSKDNAAEPDLIPRSISSRSIDSISQELNHFRPIRSCPLTPPRRLPSGKVVEPKLIRTTPRNMSGLGLTSPVETNLSDIDAVSPVMQRRLSQLADERKSQVEQMSKSTNTGAVVSPNENLNPEIGIPNVSGQLTFAHRNTDLKDISNSALTTHGSPPKKLIIPLEPDFTENNDWLEEPNGFSLMKIKRVTPKLQLSNSARKRAEKLSRRQMAKHSKVRYTEENPQPSVMNWVKKVSSVCVYNDGHVDGLVDNRLDEVHGDKKQHEKRFTQDVDDNLKNSKDVSSNQRSRRNHKMYKDPDFVYNESPNSRNCDENSSYTGSDELSLARNTKKRKTSSTSSTPRKKSKSSSYENQSSCRTKIGLKNTKQLLKSGKQSKSRGVKHNKSKPMPTLQHYFCKFDSNMKESENASSVELDQEEKDHLLALELQKQFQLEAKWRLNAVRFKGTSDEYSLRHKQKT